jgi:hypothetical protein
MLKGRTIIVVLIILSINFVSNPCFDGNVIDSAIREIFPSRSSRAADIIYNPHSRIASEFNEKFEKSRMDSDYTGESYKDEYQKCVEYYRDELGLEIENCDQYCVFFSLENTIIRFAKKYPDLISACK